MVIESRSSLFIPLGSREIGWSTSRLEDLVSMVLKRVKLLILA